LRTDGAQKRERVWLVLLMSFGHSY
jgi:hypothetical protein